MASPYRALCAELVAALAEWQLSGGPPEDTTDADLIARARALLAQPEPEGSKPVVDYNHIPEIATEAQIRSAAQYLVKKKNCDGDLIPAIEYAIARWGRLTPHPDPKVPTDEELLQLAREWNSGCESIDFDCITDYAREVLSRWGANV